MDPYTNNNNNNNHITQHTQNNNTNLPRRPGIKVKPRQLLPRILDILLRLHAHIKDRTILTRANITSFDKSFHFFSTRSNMK